MSSLSMRRGIALAAFAALQTFAAQAATVITPSANANVTEGYGFSSASELLVNWENANANVGLLQFDLSGITEVSSATLDLYHLYNQFYEEGETGVFSLFVNTSAWTGGATTDWDSRPSHEATAAATITLTTSDAAGQYHRFDVTTTVQDWASGSKANFGFTFARTDATNPFLYFASTHNGPALAPVLTVTAVPEAGAVLMSVSGLACVGAFAMARRRKQQQG